MSARRPQTSAAGVLIENPTRRPAPHGAAPTAVVEFVQSLGLPVERVGHPNKRYPRSQFRHSACQKRVFEAHFFQPARPLPPAFTDLTSNKRGKEPSREAVLASTTSLLAGLGQRHQGRVTAVVEQGSAGSANAEFLRLFDAARDTILQKLDKSDSVVALPEEEVEAVAELFDLPAAACAFFLRMACSR